MAKMTWHFDVHRHMQPSLSLSVSHQTSRRFRVFGLDAFHHRRRHRCPPGTAVFRCHRCRSLCVLRAQVLSARLATGAAAACARQQRAAAAAATSCSRRARSRSALGVRSLGLIWHSLARPRLALALANGAVRELEGHHISKVWKVAAQCALGYPPHIAHSRAVPSSRLCSGAIWTKVEELQQQRHAATASSCRRHTHSSSRVA